jgi:hypothetical protein
MLRWKLERFQDTAGKDRSGSRGGDQSPACGATTEKEWRVLRRIAAGLP